MDTRNNTPVPSPYKMTSASASSEGRYSQRLRQLEMDVEMWKTKFLEMSEWKQKFDDLYEWKQQVNQWIYDQFEFKFDTSAIQLTSDATNVTNDPRLKPTPSSSNINSDKIVIQKIKVSTDSSSNNDSDSIDLNETNNSNITSGIQNEENEIMDEHSSSYDSEEPSLPTGNPVKDRVKNGETLNTSHDSSSSLSVSVSSSFEDLQPPIPPKKRKTIVQEQTPVTVNGAKTGSSKKTNGVLNTIGRRQSEREQSVASRSRSNSDTPTKSRGPKRDKESLEQVHAKDCQAGPSGSSSSNNARKRAATSESTHTESTAVVNSANKKSSVDSGSSNSPVDEEARCSVCDDKYAEENNEMLFCDSCNICVHQACYGVTEIPKKDWFCRPCEAGLKEKPPCTLCPNVGGAMVPMRSPSNSRWCHVFCALWVPEVSFRNKEKMDLVINVDKIPKARWLLLCSLCKKGKGTTACIQCHWNRCLTAFHVTCASKHHLKMDGILDDNLRDGVALQAYCNVHKNKGA